MSGAVQGNIDEYATLFKLFPVGKEVVSCLIRDRPGGDASQFGNCQWCGFSPVERVAAGARFL